MMELLMLHWKQKAGQMAAQQKCHAQKLAQPPAQRCRRGAGRVLRRWLPR